MARGITQEQVNAAADTILSAGENPTVEKVRAALGTGSPNTITRMLDTWRGQLGERLRQLSALPELPGPVGQAMIELWRLASEQAEHALTNRFADQQAALEAARADLVREREGWEARLQAAETRIAQAQVARDLAEHACATLDGQLQDSHTLRADLLLQRDRLQTQHDHQAQELAHLRAELQQRDAALTNLRQRHDNHVQTIEDRAHREVDRARQETKAVQQRLNAVTREHAQALAAWEQQRNVLLRAQGELEQRLAHEAGRAAALAAHVPRTATRAARAPVATKKVPGAALRPKSRKR